MTKPTATEDFTIKYGGESYTFMNNFAKNSIEHNLYNNVLKAIKQMKYMNSEPWNFDESILFDDARCLRNNVSNAFVKLSLSNEPLNFSISEYEYNIFESFNSNNRDEQEARYIKFINQIQHALELLHKMYIDQCLQSSPYPKIPYDEQIKQKLLAEASINRPKSLNRHELAVEMNNFFLMKPRTMTVEDMYTFYVVNLPHKTIKHIPQSKTATIIKKSQTATTQNSQTTVKSNAETEVKHKFDRPLETLDEHIAKLNKAKQTSKTITIKVKPKTDPFKELLLF